MMLVAMATTQPKRGCLGNRDDLLESFVRLTICLKAARNLQDYNNYYINYTDCLCKKTYSNLKAPVRQNAWRHTHSE